MDCRVAVALVYFLSPVSNPAFLLDRVREAALGAFVEVAAPTLFACVVVP